MTSPELQTDIMRYLTKALSATADDVAQGVKRELADVQDTLGRLEEEGMVEKLADTIRKKEYFSPTTRGVLKTRQFAKY